MSESYKWKVVMVGDFAVGKTSLVRRFVHNEFSDSYLTTIGVKVSKKDIVKADDYETSLLLWDIAGSDRFGSISTEYLKGASAAIIVADITRESSISMVQSYIDMLHSVNRDAPYQISINKSDTIADPRILDYYRSAEFTSKFPSAGQVSLTSAKNGDNVEKLFLSLADSIRERIIR
jgi:small GTP-binding protein